jgi:hypothetical protein
MIAAGPDRGRPQRDDLYLTYLAEGVKILRSEDGGEHFSRSRPAQVVYRDVQVGPSGTIYFAGIGRASEKDEHDSIFLSRSREAWDQFDDGSMASEKSQPVDGRYAASPILVDEKRHVIHVVYATAPEDGAWDVFLATTSDDGASWTRTKLNDDPHCANHLLPAAAVDSSTGRVHAFWYENRIDRGLVAYASCDADGRRCEPNEALSEPFPMYSLAHHSPQPTARIFHAARRLP